MASIAAAIDEMLNELGVRERDSFRADQRLRQIYNEIDRNKLNDFPVARLPELKKWAGDNDCASYTPVINKMNRMVAQGPQQADATALMERYEQRKRDLLIPALEHIQSVEEEGFSAECFGLKEPAQAKEFHESQGCAWVTHGVFLNPFATSEQREWAAKRVRPPRRELWPESNQNTGAA